MGLSDPNGVSSETYSQIASKADIPFFNSMTSNMLCDIKGDISVGGTVYFGENMTFGDASADTLTMNGILALGAGSTMAQTDNAFSTAQDVCYLRSSCTATTGSHSALRLRGESEATGAATSEVRGLHTQGVSVAALYAGTVNAIYAEAIAKDTTTVVTLRGAMIACDSEGTPTSITNMYGAHIRVKTSVAPGTKYVVATLENEKFGSGVAVDSFLDFATTTWTGGETVATYVIDMGNLTGTVTSVINAGAVTATNLLEVDASGDGGVTVAADGMTADPEGAAEAGYITILVGATGYQIPIYAA